MQTVSFNVIAKIFGAYFWDRNNVFVPKMYHHALPEEDFIVIFVKICRKLSKIIIVIIFVAVLFLFTYSAYFSRYYFIIKK